MAGHPRAAPTPKIRFYLHSKAATTGHRPLYLSVGIGETRPVRQATGYSLHPAYFSPSAPHALKGANGYRTINEKLDELRLATPKAGRRLEDEGQLSNAALVPLLKEAAQLYINPEFAVRFRRCACQASEHSSKAMLRNPQLKPDVQ